MNVPCPFPRPTGPTEPAAALEAVEFALESVRNAKYLAPGLAGELGRAELALIRAAALLRVQQGGG